MSWSPRRRESAIGTVENVPVAIISLSRKFGSYFGEGQVSAQHRRARLASGANVVAQGARFDIELMNPFMEGAVTGDC
jgi:hypothetical protein